ncbi:MAG: hypothetical protein JKY48_09790 [Flavobacteriales bacterium]|nr:hypothetical protein [Flavobacteriales bacterium]
MKSVFIYSCIMLFALSSCTEKTKVNLVSGTLFQDCESRLGSFEIALKANEGGSFNNQLILGSAIADVNGAFNFTYELEEDDDGTGDLILVKSTGFETLIEGIALNENFNATLYRNNISTIALSLSGTKVYTINDTLYYGVAGNTEDYLKIQPIIGVLDTLQSNAVTGNQSEKSVQLYYGVGKVDFEKAKTDTSFNNLKLNLIGCENIGLADIEIN